MRGLALSMELLTLLPIACVRPFVGVILWSWVSFMDPQQLVWGFASDLPWAMLAFVATLVGCVLAGEPRRLALPNTTIMLLLFLACISLTSLAAQAPAGPVMQKWESVAKTVAGLLLTGALLTDRQRIHALVWILVLSLGFFGVKGGTFAIMTAGQYRVFGPPVSMIADNNHLAAALLVSLPLMNYLRLQSRYRVVRAGLAAAMGLTLLAVLASYSRGALLGLGVMVAFLWRNSPNKLAFGVVLAAVVGGGVAFMPDRWMDRMNTIETYQQDGSAMERLVMWSTAWKLALANPLTGAGFMGPYTRSVVDTVDPTSPARAVHSIWFEVLGEHGFPTFFVWLGITVTGLVNCRRILRAAQGVAELRWAYDLAKMVQVAIPVYLVAGTFLSLSYWDGYLTILVVLAAARVQVMARAGPVSAGQPGGRPEDIGMLPAAAPSRESPA
jgi:probable O-glycosylation ligase (exosortase A-associated)